MIAHSEATESGLELKWAIPCFPEWREGIIIDPGGAGPCSSRIAVADGSQEVPSYPSGLPDRARREQVEESFQMTGSLAYWLIKKINKANRDFHLIADGDRIAVAVSGGKDSFTLLELLRRRQRSVPTEYTLVPMHIVSDWRCTDQDQCAWLEQHFQSLGLEYAIREIIIMGSEGGNPQQPSCFWCAWNRRKTLFQTAHELGCNKLALGHHADDIAQTTLLNLFYHGRLETMEPKVEFFDGVITVIRPLAYVPEKDIVRFAQAAGFAPQRISCPHAATSQRAKMAQLLQQIEKECPQVKINLFRAVYPDQARVRRRKGRN